MNLKACLNFARVRFESFFRGYFSVFTRRITGKETGRKRKNDLIIFFCRKIKTGS